MGSLLRGHGTRVSALGNAGVGFSLHNVLGSLFLGSGPTEFDSSTITLWLQAKRWSLVLTWGLSAWLNK